MPALDLLSVLNDSEGHFFVFANVKLKQVMYFDLAGSWVVGDK